MSVNSSHVDPNVVDPISVNWQQLSPFKWFEHLQRLSDSYIAAEDRLYWMNAMRDWLQHNISLTENSAPAYQNPQWSQETLEPVLVIMAELSYKLCDWPLIIEIHRYLQGFEHHTPETWSEVESLQLAVAYWQMGQLQEAKAHLASCLPFAEQDSPVISFYQQIERDISRTRFAVADCRDGELQLCLLEEQHLSSFSWVYNDPQIAKLCNLPDFSDDEQWFDWLEKEQSNSCKALFAVVHQKWGIIGSVCIEVRDGAGFFYYWLGQDFQGGGYGPKAVLLMLTLAEKYLAMGCCYAKVFDYNLPSQKAMSKMGFKPLPFKLAPPNQSQLYFYRGPERPLEFLKEQLAQLMRYTDVDNQLLPQQ